ncbi:hypothetical protein FJT64_026614 [Amphibalanus amphitrite]|uniref:Uncharacterized protein n=1 Tax=Amphibalanus amphitrite TaxID=1232801 RepID=A0A6A4VYK9_AMPAM|nr:hypothetical protein FJT64_026614 [Amphibalanus amphitrite]
MALIDLSFHVPFAYDVHVFHVFHVVVDVSALTRGVRLLSVEVPLTAVPAGPAASPAADIERGTCPPPFGPLQLLQSAAQLSVSVSLAVPLDLLPRPAPARCAYGRLLAVVSQRGLQRSGVLQLIQQLNEPPSPAAAEGAAPRFPTRPACNNCWPAPGVVDRRLALTTVHPKLAIIDWLENTSKLNQFISSTCPDFEQQCAETRELFTGSR